MSDKVTYLKWKLTEREYRAFLGIANSMTTRQMAAALGISVKTVGTYRERIKKKTGLKTNVDIALYHERNPGEFK